MQGRYVGSCSGTNGCFSFLLLFPFPLTCGFSCSEAGWKGVVGEVPSLAQVQAALTERDLYM